LLQIGEGLQRLRVVALGVKITPPLQHLQSILYRFGICRNQRIQEVCDLPCSGRLHRSGVIARREGQEGNDEDRDFREGSAQSE